ncbi:MAG: hypothetical protein ABIQ61_03140 [Ornithinibacter sp.]
MVGEDSHRAPRSREGLGEAALTCGVVAFVFVFVPIIGDFVAVPAALAAMSLCIVGVIREDRGVATNSGKALAGGLLGLIAAFIMFVTISATGTFG